MAATCSDQYFWNLARSLFRRSSEFKGTLDAIKEFFTTFDLTVARVLNLHPRTAPIVRYIAAIFPLRDDSFKIELTRLRVQAGAVALQIIEIQQPRLPTAISLRSRALRLISLSDRRSSPLSQSRSNA